jgi:hypothetical protein
MNNIYIESTRNADISGSTTANTWATAIKSGVAIEEGDVLSIDQTCINIRGDIGSSVEIIGRQPNDLMDSQIRMSNYFYVANNDQFNIPLPLTRTLLKFADPQQTNYTEIDLSTFVNFQNAYPLRAIEGVWETGQDAEGNPVYEECVGGGVSSLPPAEIDGPSDTRFYCQNYKEGMSAPSSSEGVPFTLLTNNIDLNLDPGYNTLPNIETKLTEQMHKRFGDADNFLQFFEDPVYYTLYGDPGVNAAYQSTPLNNISDKSYVSYGTASGNVIKARLEGQWDAQLEYEGALVDNGVGYNEAQGLKMYYSNIASATPFNMKASCHINKNFANFKNSTNMNITDPNFHLYGMYTGDSNINGAGVGNFGVSGMVIADNQDRTTSTISIEVANKRESGFTINNLEVFTTPAPNTVIVSNLVYNETTMANLGLIDYNRLEFSDGTDFLMPMDIGRVDDESSTYFNVMYITSPNCHLNGASYNSYITSLYATRNSKKMRAYLGDTNVKCYSRYDPTFMSNMSNFSLPSLTDYQFTDTKGRFGDQSLSQLYGVPCVPVYKKTGGNLQDIPMCGWIIKEQITYPGPSYIGAIEIGEYFGPQYCNFNNLNSFIVTTQKHLPIGKGSLYPSGDTQIGCAPFTYFPYINIGANDPSWAFSNENRMALSGLHTPILAGNGSFSAPDENQNSQWDEIVCGINFGTSSVCRGLITPDGAPSEPFPLGINRSIVSAQAGIGIYDWSIPNYNGVYETLTAINYKYSLLDKLGFELEDILPTYGQVNNYYSSPNISSSQTPEQKYKNGVFPLTTNGIIDSSGMTSLVLNALRENAANLGCLPVYDQVLVSTSSCSIIARRLPQKLSFPYLTIMSNIINDNIYYGSANASQRLPVIAYATLSFAQGDFLFGNSEFRYVFTKPQILSLIKIDIRRPNGSVPILGENSSIIFKIQKNNIPVAVNK